MDLDRDPAVVPEVVREIDRGHAAASKLALNAVAISQLVLEALAEVHHVGLG
jgi:hypothetical protein